MGPQYDVPLHIALSMLLAAANVGERAPAQQLPGSALQAPAPARSVRAFDEQAWLRAIAEGAGGDTLAAYRKRIFRTGAGRYYVPSAEERRVILALRDDSLVRVAVDSFVQPAQAPAVLAASAGTPLQQPASPQLKGRLTDRASAAGAREAEAASRVTKFGAHPAPQARP